LFINGFVWLFIAKKCGTDQAQEGLGVDCWAGHFGVVDSVRNVWPGIRSARLFFFISQNV
jgi:hypothetical protein